MARKPSSKKNNTGAKLLPVVSKYKTVGPHGDLHDEDVALLDKNDSVINSLEEYMNKMTISTNGRLTKLFNIMKAEFLRKQLINNEVNAVQKDNFTPVRTYSDIVNNLSVKLAKEIGDLDKMNAISTMRTDGMLGRLYKKMYQTIKPEPLQSGNPNDILNQGSNKLSLNQLAFIDKLSVEIATRLNGFSPTENKPSGKPSKPISNEEKQNIKKQNTFFDKMATWLGYEKARNAIQKTRDESKQSRSAISNIITKTGKMIKSAFDGLLDFPVLLAGIVGGFVTKFVGIFTEVLSLSLLAARKVIFSKFGLIGVAGALLLSDTFKDYLISGIKKIFGNDNGDKVKSVLDSFNWANVLIGVGIGGKIGAMIGTMIGGPVGAVIGGILGMAIGGISGVLLSWSQEGTLEQNLDRIKEALNMGLEPLNKKIENIKKKREEIRGQYDNELIKISDISKQLDDMVYQKDSLYKAYLEKELIAATSRRDSMKDQMAALEIQQNRSEKDAEILKKYGGFGQAVVWIGQIQDSINNWIIRLLTGFDSVEELGAFADRKILEAGELIKEKIDKVKKWIDDLIALPGKLIDAVTTYISTKIFEIQDYISTKFSETILGKGANASKSGTQIGNMIAKEYDKSNKVKAIESNLDKQKQDSQNTLINAPTTNTRQTMVQNNATSTIIMRPSPMDERYRNLAW